MTQSLLSPNHIQSIEQAVIFTDCVDIAFNEMHQVLLNELATQSIDKVHIHPMIAVKNFSVVNASFNIRLFADLFPPVKTLFIVVVNGIHSSPERLFGKTKHGLTFIGNNSGYFNWLIEDFGLEILYQNKITREVNGKSFGGKYVQMPTAAKIIAGIPFEQMGDKKEKNFLREYKIEHGTIVHCDNFGLMKIKAPLLKGYQEGEKLKFFVNGHYKTEGIYTEKMKQQPDNTWVLFSGSSLSGLPELGKVRALDSAGELGVREGDNISWERA